MSRVLSPQAQGPGLPHKAARIHPAVIRQCKAAPYWWEFRTAFIFRVTFFRKIVTAFFFRVTLFRKIVWIGFEVHWQAYTSEVMKKKLDVVYTYIHCLNFFFFKHSTNINSTYHFTNKALFLVNFQNVFGQLSLERYQIQVGCHYRIFLNRLSCQPSHSNTWGIGWIYPQSSHYLHSHVSAASLFAGWQVASLAKLTILHF